MPYWIFVHHYKNNDNLKNKFEKLIYYEIKKKINVVSNKYIEQYFYYWTFR